jgi:thymidylate kinase
MIATKLILIEGLPCSGKSTTAGKIAESLAARGIACRCFREWAEDHPIPIGRMEDLPSVIATAKAREGEVLRQWEDFAVRAARSDAVTVLESRLWQTHAMYRYLSGGTPNEAAESSRRIAALIAILDPVLVYLAPADIGRALAQAAGEKNRKWREEGREGSWEEWGNAAYEQQQWFADRGRKGPHAVIAFFEEWAAIADGLYEELPFRKIKIRDPRADWDLALRRIRAFLEMDG